MTFKLKKNDTEGAKTDTKEKEEHTNPVVLVVTSHFWNSPKTNIILKEGWFGPVQELRLGYTKARTLGLFYSSS